MDALTTVWICINLVGAVCVNLGQNIMKLGHNKRAEMDMPEEEKPNIRRIRQWQIGVVVFVGGGIANFVSFGYAPQSLLSALGSIQFVSNVFFASFVLKEEVTLRVVFATACIVGGCVLIVVFSSSSQEILTGAELMSYYQSTAYITYICLMFVLMVGFYMVYRYGKQVMAKQDVPPACWDRLLPVSYAMFCAPIGTQSVLFSKSVSVLLRTTFSGNSQLGEWFFWVMLLAFILTSVFWVTRLNKSLKLFPAIVIVPTMQIGWTVFSIISGGIYFQEFQEYNALEMSMFLVGVSVIMVGVFYLTPPPKAAARYVDMDADDSTRNLTVASPRTPSSSHRRYGAGSDDSTSMDQPLSPCGSPHSSAQRIPHLRPHASELAAQGASSEDSGRYHGPASLQGPAALPKPISVIMGNFEEEWASSPSMRQPRRTLSLQRFSLDATDLEQGGAEFSTPQESPSGNAEQAGSRHRTPPSKRHSFSSVSTPREGPLNSQLPEPSGEGFAMRLRAFRRALMEDWDLDFSALRQIGGAPAAGGSVQVPGVLGLPVPIMGEWYPTQQPDPRASLSPRDAPEAATQHPAPTEREGRPRQAPLMRQRSSMETTSMQRQQEEEEGASQQASQLARRSTVAGDHPPQEIALPELRLDVQLQGTQGPPDASAEVVIAVVPNLKGGGQEEASKSPTSPLVNAAIEPGSSPSDAAADDPADAGVCPEDFEVPADGCSPHAAAAVGAAPLPQPKQKAKPVAEPGMADPPPRLGTPKQLPAPVVGASFSRSESLPMPHRPPPPPPPHGSAGKLSGAPPTQPSGEHAEALPVSPAVDITRRTLQELQVEHDVSSPDTSRDEADVTTPLTEGVATESAAAGSSARKHLVGPSWRRALSGRSGGGKEEDKLSSAADPDSGPVIGSAGRQKSSGKQKSGRNLWKGGAGHEELHGSSEDEDGDSTFR